MTRLHIITGPAKSGRSNAAAEKQRSEPAADWFVCDGPTQREAVDAYLGRGRNVIWVAERVRDEDIEVTTQHMVQLPTTFGSVVTAATTDNRTRRVLSLASNTNWWVDSKGSTYVPSDVIDARVLFDAKEA